MSHYLTVCERGNVRSVTAAIILKDLFMLDDVLPVGVKTSSPDTLEILTQWADVIFTVGTIQGIERLALYVEPSRVIHLDVGEDSWGQPMNPELVSRVIDQLSLKANFIDRPTRWEIPTYMELNRTIYLKRFA